MAEYSVTWLDAETNETKTEKQIASSEDEAVQLVSQRLQADGASSYPTPSNVQNVRKTEFYDSEHYYDLSEAFSSVKDAYNQGVAETLKETPQLIGKTLFNTGIFAAKAALEGLRQSPSILAGLAEQKLKHGQYKDDEQQARLERMSQKRHQTLWKNDKVDD